MQIIIDLPTRQYNNIKDLANTRLADNISYRGIIIEALGSIKRGTVLSNCTNGDVIKALFPNAHDWIVRQTIEGDALGEDEVSHFLELPNNLIINRFTEDWWNAPYKGEK